MISNFVPDDELRQIAANANIEGEVNFSAFKVHVTEAFIAYFNQHGREEVFGESKSKQDKRYKAIGKQAEKLAGKLYDLSHGYGQPKLVKAIDRTIQNRDTTKSIRDMNQILALCGAGNRHFSIDGIAELLEVLSAACSDVEDFSYSSPEFSEADALYAWVFEIQAFWNKYMETDFVIPKWDKECHEYISGSGNKAFDTLKALAEHLERVPTSSALHKAMSCTKKNRFQITNIQSIRLDKASLSSL